MQLSIIIPTFDEAASITHCLRRARALEPREVIVSDGGSTDATAQIAQRHGAIVVTGPRGRGGQLNLGAQQATGDILLFLHADTWLGPPAARQIEKAMADSQVQFGAFQQTIEADGLLYRWLEKGNAWRARRWCLPYGDQGIFMRRNVFAEEGGFPAIPFMEDLLLVRRLKRRSRPVLLPGPLHVSARRWQQNGVVRQTLRNWSLLLAERGGISPARLARWYGAMRPNEMPHEMQSTDYKESRRARQSDPTRRSSVEGM